jgi:isocitrate dehydrogenase
VIETIESGIVTKDLALIADPAVPKHVTTEGFITAIAERLTQKLGTGLALR